MDYAGYSDIDILHAVEEFKQERRNRDRTIPRVVKNINSLGYSIDRETYKHLEYRPLQNAEHVRNGVLNYAYAALDTQPVVNQDVHTFSAMQALAQARRTRDLSYADMAREISDRGFPITPDEYRTCEQGTTKRVPAVVLIHAMMFLRLTPERVFHSVTDAYATGDY